MKRLRSKLISARYVATLVIVAAFAIPLLVASAAGAAIVTVGSPLIGSFSTSTIGTGNTLFNLRGEPNPTSPVDGAVVGWNIIGASGGPYFLRILAPTGLGQFTGAGKSAGATPLSTGLQHFTTLLPIKTGQLIAFDHTNAGDTIGTLSVPGNEWGFFSPTLEEGATATPSVGPNIELGFNAEVQPAPTIFVIGTTSGSTAGGTSVLISGTDLEGTTAVKFGGAAATFGQVSETAVLATSPASATAGSVPVSVTTRAGTATAAQSFTYQAPPSPAPLPPTPGPAIAKCVVPKLLGKHLKAAKKAIRAAKCKVGQVTKEPGVTLGDGTVVKQSPKSGTKKPVGAAVSVRLG
ncbi:MAG: IPT/TIG domain-containing protein [Actinobacteria bacterium]|nr:IPT/TIG domain-containing protein [Actinomycetota bacterium]